MPSVDPIDPRKDLEADILAVRAGRMTPRSSSRAGVRIGARSSRTSAPSSKRSTRPPAALVLDIDPRRTRSSASRKGAPTRRPRQSRNPPPTDLARLDMTMNAPAVASPGAAQAVLTRSVPRVRPDGFEPGSTVTRAAVFTPAPTTPRRARSTPCFPPAPASGAGAPSRNWPSPPTPSTSAAP